MNNKEKDFMSQLSNLDNFSVEEIAEKYPALNESAKKRILKKCMKKESFSADINYDGEEEIILSKTKNHHRSLWYRYGSFAAAFVLTAVTITSVIMLNVSPKGKDYYEIDRTPSVNSYYSDPYSRSDDDMLATSKNGYTDDSYFHSNNSKHPGTSIGKTPQKTTDNEKTTVYPDETSVNDPDDPTSPVTPEAQAQNKFFDPDGVYYVNIPCDYQKVIMAFIFARDGSLTTYYLDDYGDIINNTMVHTNYAVAENRFSYFLSNGDARNGTIINSNGTNSFSVQFDDGQLCDFSTERPNFETPDNIQEKLLSLNGTSWSWYSDDHSENRRIEFNYDNFSGQYITIVAESATVPFTYEKNGDEYYMYMPGYGETIILKANLLDAESTDPTLAVRYPDKGTIYFYLTSKPESYGY